MPNLQQALEIDSKPKNEYVMSCRVNREKKLSDDAENSFRR